MHHTIEERFIFPVLAERISTFKEEHIESHKGIHDGAYIYFSNLVGAQNFRLTDWHRSGLARSIAIEIWSRTIFVLAQRIQELPRQFQRGVIHTHGRRGIFMLSYKNCRLTQWCSWLGRGFTGRQLEETLHFEWDRADLHVVHAQHSRHPLDGIESFFLVTSKWLAGSREVELE